MVHACRGAEDGARVAVGKSGARAVALEQTADAGLIVAAGGPPEAEGVAVGDVAAAVANDAALIGFLADAHRDHIADAVALVDDHAALACAVNRAHDTAHAAAAVKIGVVGAVFHINGSGIFVLDRAGNAASMDALVLPI
jgi:hypothetical protein